MLGHDLRRERRRLRRSVGLLGHSSFLYEELTWPHFTVQFGGRVNHASYDPEGGLTPRDFTDTSGSIGLLFRPAALDVVAGDQRQGQVQRGVAGVRRHVEGQRRQRLVEQGLVAQVAQGAGQALRAADLGAVPGGRIGGDVLQGAEAAQLPDPAIRRLEIDRATAARLNADASANAQISTGGVARPAKPRAAESSELSRRWALSIERSSDSRW